MAKRRKINTKNIKSQVMEAVLGGDGLEDFDLGNGDKVVVRLPIGLTSDDPDAVAFVQCATDKERCLQVLSHLDGVSAEEQWDKWCNAQGGDDEDACVESFMAALSFEMLGAQERLKNFRFRG